MSEPKKTLYRFSDSNGNVYQVGEHVSGLGKVTKVEYVIRRDSGMVVGYRAYTQGGEGDFTITCTEPVAVVEKLSLIEVVGPHEVPIRAGEA